MSNNNESMMNAEGRNPLLQYNEEPSVTPLSTPESDSEALTGMDSPAEPPVQYESRKARRMAEEAKQKELLAAQEPTVSATKNEVAQATAAETEDDSQNSQEEVEAPVKEEDIPAETENDSAESEEAVSPEAETIIEVSDETAEFSAPPAETPVNYSLEVVSSSTAGQPQYSYVNGPMPTTETPVSFMKSPKEYWGGIAILWSGLIFLGMQIAVSIFFIAYIIFSSPDIVSALQGDESGTETLGSVLTDSPWLLVLTQGLMYATWLGCMWWVTKYRSGVQRGKKFWKAFKDNFRLNNFKKMDIVYGAGIAAFMVGLQYLVLNVIPSFFPSLDLSEADNTGSFKDLEGVWFYIIAFGLGGLIGPICEELFFRGFLLRGLTNHFSYKNSGRNLDILQDGFQERGLSGFQSMMVSYRHRTHNARYILAAIVSSILFGFMHYQGGTSFGAWLVVIFTGTLGFVFALVTLKLNRIFPAMIAHVLYNSTLFAMLALSM